MIPGKVSIHAQSVPADGEGVTPATLTIEPIAPFYGEAQLKLQVGLLVLYVGAVELDAAVRAMRILAEGK